MGYRVVVAGATGNVGREMLNILAEREFPADEVAALASSRSAGDVIDFGETGKKLTVKNIEHFDWSGWDMACSRSDRKRPRNMRRSRRPPAAS
jgi:aspartate-semialdehyde dehydrogenase